MVISNQKVSLLEKLNLSLDQLDYKYIENCKNAKQIEKILRVLRSGEEGVYPDLIKFAEDRLQQVDPSNKYLLSAKGIMTYSDLPESERQNILAGLEEWSRECSKRTGQNTLRRASEIPPVRGQKISEAQPQSDLDEEKQKNETKSKICKPRSYQEWEKFDVDEELKKLADKEETEKNESDTEEIKLDKSISVAGLSAIQREDIANSERIKGNEAFKAQDYEEAVLYYTRSLSASRTAKTLNNRAQTHLKLRNYLEAVIDCNEVISMEPNNIKALYRRGIAHKEAQMLDLAVIDFEIILRLDPENKSAQDQLEQIESSLIQKVPERRKVIIEELESETTDNKNDGSTFDTRNDEDKRNEGKRLAIEEIAESPRQVLDEICNCIATDDETRPLSKNTKEMLSIFNNHGSKKRSKTEKVTFEEMENQKSRTNSKSNVNDFSVSQRPIEKDNTKICFKDIQIQNSFLEKSNICKTESFMKEKEYSTKIEEMYSELRNFKIDDAKEKMEEKSINNALQSTKENSSKVEENNHKGKSKTKKQIVLHRASAFEFLQAWLSNGCNSKNSNGAACLLAVQPQELPKILTNKIDGPLLSSLLMAIKYLFSTGKLTESMEYLKFLVQVPRIKLTALFLSNDEKNDIDDLLTTMEIQLGENLDHARKVLSIN